jgi:predicted GNAT family acetyltransferase
VSWVIAKKSDTLKLIEFLTEHEHRCVSLTSRLLKPRDDPFLERKPGILLNTGSSGTITGVLYLSPLGSILPVFTEATTVTESDRNEIGLFTRRFVKRFHSIIGSTCDVGRTESILSAAPVSRNNYLLMSKADADLPGGICDPSRELPPEMKIRKADLKDIKALYPLQKNFEMEEVLVHSERFNPGGCMAHLKHSLSNQIIFCAEKGKTIVAKGGTNAIGFNYCQLGGIYTLPEYRNRGISTALVIRLVQEIVLLGKKVCLFVKTKNLPALRVYQKLNFDLLGDFSVSYFF